MSPVGAPGSGSGPGPGPGSGLERRAVVTRFLAGRNDDLLVVAGLGSTAWDITAAGDHPANLPLWGAMGGAAVLGLGLALAQPDRRVLVVTGDGEALMGLGALSTIGRAAPTNLAVVVIDNGRYGETGMQTSHTSREARPEAGGEPAAAPRTDLAAVARACGWPVVITVADGTGPDSTGPDGAGLDEAVAAARRQPGPVFVTVEVSNEPVPLVLPPRDGRHLTDRFRRHLGLGPQ